MTASITEHRVKLRAMACPFPETIRKRIEQAELSGTALFILHYVDYVNGEARPCFFNRAGIARECGLSSTTVSVAINKLFDLGLLTSKRSQGHLVLLPTWLPMFGGYDHVEF